MVEHNPFASPSVTEGPPLLFSTHPPWFSVGRRKLGIMCSLSLGLYAIWWFERQFRFQKRAYYLDTWPVLRALFSIFFAYPLFRAVSLAAEAEKVRFSWSASTMAGLYFVLVLSDRIVDRMSTVGAISEFSSVALGVGLIIGIAYLLTRVQETINAILTNSHPEEAKNDNFSRWNVALIVAGGLVYVLGLLGLMVPEPV